MEKIFPSSLPSLSLWRLVSSRRIDFVCGIQRIPLWPASNVVAVGGIVMTTTRTRPLFFVGRNAEDPNRGVPGSQALRCQSDSSEREVLQKKFVSVTCRELSRSGLGPCAAVVRRSVARLRARSRAGARPSVSESNMYDGLPSFAPFRLVCCDVRVGTLSSSEPKFSIQRPQLGNGEKIPVESPEGERGLRPAIRYLPMVSGRIRNSTCWSLRGGGSV